MILSPARILRQTALRYADEIALVNYERNRRWTYRELHRLTNRACNMLTDRFRLGEGDKVATLLQNDHMGLLFTMSMKTDCTNLWLGIMDSLKEHLYQLDYVKPSLIFIEKDLLDQYYEPLTQRNIAIVSMDEPDEARPGVHHFWDLAAESSPEDPGAQFVADDANEHIWLLKFTGGTTGRGKCFISLARNESPSILGISRSSVMTSGRSSTILSLAIYGSMAVPTISMSS